MGSTAHLVVIFEPSTGKVLGYDIWGPSRPDVFMSGKAGKNRACAVMQTNHADSYAQAAADLALEISGQSRPVRPQWEAVHKAMVADGSWERVRPGVRGAHFDLLIVDDLEPF